MLIVNVYISVKPDMVEKFIEATSKNAAASINEPAVTASEPTIIVAIPYSSNPGRQTVPNIKSKIPISSKAGNPPRKIKTVIAISITNDVVALMKTRYWARRSVK